MHDSRSVGTTPRRGGDRVSRHGKVYKDDCRIASCEVSPYHVMERCTRMIAGLHRAKYHLAKREGDRSDVYTADSSAEQPGRDFLFLVLFIVSRYC